MCTSSAISIWRLWPQQTLISRAGVLPGPYWNHLYCFPVSGGACLQSGLKKVKLDRGQVTDFAKNHTCRQIFLFYINDIVGWNSGINSWIYSLTFFWRTAAPVAPCQFITSAETANQTQQHKHQLIREYILMLHLLHFLAHNGGSAKNMFALNTLADLLALLGSSFCCGALKLAEYVSKSWHSSSKTDKRPGHQSASLISEPVVTSLIKSLSKIQYIMVTQYFCIAHAPYTCWNGSLCLLVTHYKSASFCLGYQGDVQLIKRTSQCS